MITPRQARTIVESVVEELAERGTWSADRVVEVGEVIEVMLAPITSLTNPKTGRKIED